MKIKAVQALILESPNYKEQSSYYYKIFPIQCMRQIKAWDIKLMKIASVAVANIEQEFSSFLEYQFLLHAKAHRASPRFLDLSASSTTTHHRMLASARVHQFALKMHQSTNSSLFMKQLCYSTQPAGRWWGQALALASWWVISAAFRTQLALLLDHHQQLGQPHRCLFHSLLLQNEMFNT